MAMHGVSGNTVIGLPATGAGVAALAGASGNHGMMAAICAALAGWTLLCAARSLGRLAPRKEA